MQNPFLIVRLVSLSLLVYLNIIVLIFASWNVHATKLSGIAVPGAIVFTIFNCCVILLLVTMSLVEVLKPSLKVALVRSECAWTAVLSIFQIGATFSATANGPLFMCQSSTAPFPTCASSSLLILAMWFETMILFGYFLLLFVTSAIHASTYPIVWSETIYAIPWFEWDTLAALPIPTKTPKTNSVASDDGSSTNRDSLAESRLDLESGKAEDKQDNLPNRPTIRRGIDAPFIRKEAAPVTRVVLPLSLPATRKKSVGREGSRYVEDFRDRRLPVAPDHSDTQSYYGSLEGVPRLSTFPLEVDDHDQPIPLPSLSEWIRADARPGRLHPVSPVSPFSDL